MAIRLSFISDYSQGVAVQPNVQPLPSPVVPTTYAQQALMRRGCNGLALSEVRVGQPERESQLNGLGELVQVVT